MLLEACNTQDGVTATPFDSFYDWDEYETRHMKPRVEGVKSYHIFTADATKDDGCSLTRYIHNGAEPSVIQMIIGQARADRSWVWHRPNRIEKLGLPDIKHVELYDK